jgi:hypothetical protein
MENFLIRAIQSLRPNSEFTVTNDDYSTIEWHVLEGQAPTHSEVNAAIKTVEAELKADEDSKAAAKTALLEKLGITADEAKLLLA